jgi:peptidyl-prolyl cis-trans isomerase SurA
MKVVRPSALLVFLAAAVPACAQPAATLTPPAPQRSVDDIAAVVNGEVITQHDLAVRTTLALFSSDLPDTPDMRSRVIGPLLRRLIEEDLKVQAATRERIAVTSDEVATQMEAIEQQNHLPSGGLNKLLASKGIETEALRQQIRADLAWSKLVRYALTRKTPVSEHAVATRLDAIRANLGKPEYHAAEIYLSLDGVKDEMETRDLAERLIEQLRHGAPFTAIARQFNQGGAADGNLGWVSEGMLDDALLTALGGLQPNMVTPPIRTADGYHILMLLEKRRVGEGMGGGPTLDMMIIDLNSLPSAGQAERDLQMRRLREILAPAGNCDDLSRLSKQAPSAAVEIKQMLPEAKLPGTVLPLIKDLAPGQISDPVDTPKGRRFFALCGRAQGSSDGVPSADDVRRQMEDEQLELVARRYLLELHGNAVVDIRQ